MSRCIYTARKQLPPTARAEQILRYYRSYRMCRGDNLAEFLVHFERFWHRALPHGATGLDGVVRLIHRLPEGWQEWARGISGDFITPGILDDEMEGDFPRFVVTILTQYIRYREPPTPEHSAYHPSSALGESSAHSSTAPNRGPAPSILGRRSRAEFEAGPSRPPQGDGPRTPSGSPQPQPSPPHESLASAEMDRLVAAVGDHTRKGKGPMRAEMERPVPEPGHLVTTGIRFWDVPDVPPAGHGDIELSPIRTPAPVNPEMPTIIPTAPALMVASPPRRSPTPAPPYEEDDEDLLMWEPSGNHEGGWNNPVPIDSDEEVDGAVVEIIPVDDSEDEDPEEEGNEGNNEVNDPDGDSGISTDDIEIE